MPVPQNFEGAHRVWMNGRLVRWADATTNIAAHALHYGTGVFEGLRCYRTETGPAVYRLEAHLDRLFDSAAAYGMKLPFQKKHLADAVLETVRANNLEDCYIRVLCWSGTHDLGISSGKWPIETAIIAWSWRTLFSEELSRTGIRVTICPWRKIHFSMLPSTAKACGQYLSSLLAAQYAKQHGYDESLLLDAAGNLAEGAAENIFLVKNGTLLTNDERSSILMGITRDSVIAIARNLGIPAEIRALTTDDLFQADEAFFTGTAAEIVAIREVDGRRIGAEGAHAHTEMFRRIFSGIITGRNETYREWLTPVPAAAGSISQHESYAPEMAAIK